MRTQIDILEAEHGKQKANLVTIRSNIESRMLQCEFTSAFEQGAIDDVEDELESLRNTYIELNQSKEEAAVMAEEVVNLKKVLDDFEGELDNEQYAIFKELTYAEIYELKKEYYDILNKIKDIEDENGSLPESENKSTTYNRLIEDRYNLLEEKLQNELVLMTILNQTTDNEHLINKLLERERQFKLLLQENKLLQDKINVIETAKSYIEMGVKEVQVSLYPILNDNMNKMLASITNKYNKLEIQDDGQIALYHDNNQKVYLRDLSLGTIDQIYFIIGICLIEGLYDSSKSIPIILDDAFVQYDYDRFKNVMEIIEKLDRQIIIFSCYEREYEYLTANNKVFNYINLSEDVEF